MQIEIGYGGESSVVDLADGTLRVGGAPSDEVRLAGLPHSMLELRLDGQRLSVTSRLSLTIGGARFPAHVPRLVVAGETLYLPRNVTLRQVPASDAAERRRQKATACVVKELVGNIYAPQDSRAATLTCLTGADAGRAFALGLRETLVGRADDVPVRIRDRAVSRRHARVLRKGEAFVLEDLRGTNGVFINGARVRRPVGLKAGDVIELGQTLLRYDGPSTPLPTTAEPGGAPAVPSEPSVVVTEEAPLPAIALSRWELLAIGLGATVAALGVVVTATLL